MNAQFIAVIQKLVAGKGKEALFSAAKCKALLADYTKGEYTKESRLLLQAVEAGAAKAIAETAEPAGCKALMIKNLQDEHFLSEDAAADVVDMLALVLRGGAVAAETAGEDEWEPATVAPPETGMAQNKFAADSKQEREMVQQRAVGADRIVQPQGKRSRLLLVSLIIGSIGILCYGIGFLYMIVDGWFDLASGYLSHSNYLSNYGQAELQYCIWFVTSTICIIPAAVLNILGWKKNSARMALIAGILYLFTGPGIPLAVMCFIAFARLKKQGAVQKVEYKQR